MSHVAPAPSRRSPLTWIAALATAALAVTGLVVVAPVQADPLTTGVVQGTVYETDGDTAVANAADVTAFRYDDATSITVNEGQRVVDASGHWSFASLPAGEYAFLIHSNYGSVTYASGFIGGEANTNEVLYDHGFERIGSGQTHTADYTLAPAATITGHATVDGASQTAIPLTVELYRLSVDDDQQQRMLRYGGAYQTGADNNYVINAPLQPGTYTIRFVAPFDNFTPEYWLSSYVTDPDNAPTFDLDPGDHFVADASLLYPRNINGRVTNTSMKAIAGIDVTAFRFDEGVGDWFPAGDAVTSASGSYRLNVPRDQTYRVSFSNESHPANPPYLPRNYPKTVATKEGKPSPTADIVLLRSSTVTGTLSLAPALPVTHPSASDVEIMLCDFDGPCGLDFGGLPVDYTASTGVYRATGLAPGKYTLFVAYTGSGNYRDAYYNNVYDRDHAAAIVVRSQVTVSGKNVMLDQGSTISGTLTDRAGAPVAGYPVGAYTASDGSVNDERPLRSATTDVNGQYVIGGLPGGSYAVRAAPENLPASPAQYVGEWYGGTYNPDRAARVRVTDGASGIDLKVDAPATIEGTITALDTGSPIADTGIDLERFDTLGGTYAQYVPNSGAYTDSAGQYRADVPPGQYIVRADGDERHPGRTFDVPTDSETPPAGTRIDVAAGDDYTASWALDLGGSYTGRVVDADGTPIEGVHVGTGDPVDGDETAANGQFRIDGLSSGPHRVMLVGDGQEYVASTGVDASATTYNALPVDLGDITVQRASTIDGTVRSATGAALENVTIYAKKPLPGGDLDPVGFAESGPGGVFSITGLPTGPIYLEFSADSPNYQTQFLGGSPVWSLSEPVALPFPSTVAHVDARLVTGGAITGVLKNKVTGKPLAGVEVDITRPGWLGAPEYTNSTATNSKGAYVFPGLEAGGYDVTFNTDEFGPSDLPYTASTASVIVADRKTLTLNRNLVPQSKVSGTVTSGGTGIEGVVVTATDVNGVTRSTTTGATGAYVLALDTEAWTLFFSDPEGRVQSAYWKSGTAAGTDDAAAASTVVVTGNGAAKTRNNIALSAGGGTIQTTVSGTNEPDPGGYFTLSRVPAGSHFCIDPLSTQKFVTPVDAEPINDLFPLKNVRAATYCIVVYATSALSDGGGRYGYGFSGPFTVTDDATTTLPAIDLGDPLFLSHLADATVVPGSEPSIGSDGTPQVGEFVTVSTGTWTRDTLYHPVQWTRNGKPIADAQELSYQLSPGDVGATIGVNVGATDFEDLVPVSYSYSATVGDPVAKAPAPMNPFSDATISGKANAGQTLTVDTGYWNITGLTFHYQWQRDGSPIAGATSKSYKLANADIDKTVNVTITALRVGFDDGVTSPAIGKQIQAAIGMKATKAPTGKVSVANFVATPGTWSPSGATITYSWREYATDTGAFTEFATAATTPVSGASAPDSRVTVVVTAAKPGYTPTSIEIPVRNGPAPVLNGTPSLTTNFPVIGEQLGVDLLGVTAAPPLSPADPDVAQSLSLVTYQWYRETTAIAGATRDTYTPVQTDIGTHLSVRVGVKANGYAPRVATQLLTTSDPVLDTAFSGGGQQIESALHRYEVGLKLTVNAGSWTITPTSLAYQWYRQLDGSTTWTKITGATNSSYTPVQADALTLLEVIVTAKAGTRTATVTTDPVLVATGILNGSGAVIPTSAHVGVPLTATPGVWDVTPTSYSWQWLRNNREIRGATSATYTPIPSDLGEEISVQVIGHRAGYQDNYPAAGSASETVEAGAAPVPTLAPTLTVAGKIANTVRDGGLVVAKAGTWPASPVSFTYHWQTATSTAGPWTDLPADYDGPNLGADSTADSTWFVPGQYYRVVVTATRAGYLPGTRASASIKLMTLP